MNKEYQIVQLHHNGITYNFTEQDINLFNNRLNRLRSEGWQPFGEPSLNIGHDHLTLVMWREITSTNGPYR